MKISVVMASNLGAYKGAAKHREDKFIRAVESFVKQIHPHKELVIVSDGCKKTSAIYEQRYASNEDIRIVRIGKQKLFSGNVRARGVKEATGEYICYLDTDDYLNSMTHLTAINSSVGEADWVYYNDTVYNGIMPKLRQVQLYHGSVGTSSIAHKKDVRSTWDGCNGYGHDWAFIQKLMKETENYKKIYHTGYLVCHIPYKVDY